MISDTLRVCVVLLSLIPGVLCEYDYSVGGLVAAAVAGFFLLMLIVIMLIVIVMWRDWYERKQMRKGIKKRSRRYWGLFPARSKSKSPSVLLSTPRSDHKLHMAGNHHLIRDSRNTTLTRADEWMAKMPPAANGFLHPADKYEEKVQSMTFEPEEEAVIVADILPPNDTNYRATHKSVHVEYDNQQNRNMGTSYRVSQKPVNVDYEHATERNADYQTVTDHDRHDDNSYYVSYNKPKTNYESRQLRHTVATTPYHVKMRQMGDDGVESDIYIAPPGMTSMSNEPDETSTAYEPVVTSSSNDPFVTYTYNTTVPAEVPAEIPGSSGIGRSSPIMVVNEDPVQPAVMTFLDSDEEAGIIPNTEVQVENDVLF